MSQQRPFTVVVTVTGTAERAAPDQLTSESWARDFAAHLEGVTGCRASATVEISVKGTAKP